MALVVSRSGAADPATKAALYRELGLRLTYDSDQQVVEAETAPPKPVRNVVSEGVSEGGHATYAHACARVYGPWP